MGMNGKKIKNRLRSVSSTMHMTKAMELVAASKLKRATTNMENGREYFEEMERTFSNLLSPETSDSKFVKPRQVHKKCIIVIAGDRGLAGGYNSNVFKLFDEVADGYEIAVAPIGKKALEHFARRGYEIVTDEFASTEDFSVLNCANLASMLATKFEEEEFDEIELIYTKYVNILTQRAESMRLLPLSGDEAKSGDNSGYVEFLPDSVSVLNALIPEYVSGLIYGAVSESFASELSARRNAMDSATQNAEEMIESLNLEYNRARQAAITQEITEIIGGSES